MRKAKLGDHVIYTSYGPPYSSIPPVDNVAIVVGVEGPEEKLPLCIFNPNGIHFNAVPFAETATPGHWSWPVIEPEAK